MCVCVFVCVCVVYMYETRCTQCVWCEKGVCECSMCVSIVPYGVHVCFDMCVCECGGVPCVTRCTRGVCCERVCECSIHVNMWWGTISLHQVCVLRNVRGGVLERSVYMSIVCVHVV